MKIFDSRYIHTYSLAFYEYDSKRSMNKLCIFVLEERKEKSAWFTLVFIQQDTDRLLQ